MDSPRQILASSGKTYNFVKKGEDIKLWTLRQECLTSTNFTKVAGLHPYKTKAQLFKAKVGRLHTPTNGDMKRGIALEAQALRMLEARIGERVFQLKKWHRHPRFPQFVGSPDGVTASGALVEVKCPRKRSYWIPAFHEAQMRWDMWIMNAELAYYVQLVDGELFVDQLERDDKLVLENLDECLSFISCVSAIAS